VGCRITPSKDRPGKTDKLPIDPQTGSPASSTDNTTWGTFDQAREAVQRFRLQCIGFVFSDDDPFCGIDLDHCFDAASRLTTQAQHWVDALNSYTERSVSGTGLHVIVKAALPPGGCRKDGIEMYDAGRFFVMTGDVFDGHASIEDRQEQVEAMHAAIFPRPEPRQNTVVVRPPSVNLADADLIAKAKSAPNGAKFARLWAGDWAEYAGGENQSGADLALASILAFWTGGDSERIDSLFRQSGLWRPKWDRKHFADGSTYGQATVKLAIGRCFEFYSGNGHEPTGLHTYRDAPEPPAWLDAEHIPAASVTPESLTECPVLPASAQLDPALAVGAAPWLDAYIEFSRTHAPRAYDGFHETTGIWVLATIAARRCAVQLGGDRFTNLYMANVARSSVWTKSTAHRMGAEVLDAAGLSFLLAPDEATPQALLVRMGRQTVEHWDNYTPDDQEKVKLRLAFAGQKGWNYDEFGMKISAMMRDAGSMSEFRGILRKLDDCPKSYEYATIARGSTFLDQPYLTVLASMTPADMAPYARRGGLLWRDGFWARFAFVAPSPADQPNMGRFPTGARIIPPALTTALHQWHQRLGTPTVIVTERSEGETGDAKLTKPKIWNVAIGPRPQQICSLGGGVYEAFYAYHDALVTLAAQSENPDLDGNYARFAEKALRVAVLLGSLENGGHIAIRHWARAQTIAEHWRQGLHNLYATVNAVSTSTEAELEDQAVRIVRRLGGATAADVRRFMRGISTAEAADLLDRLTKSGVLHTEKTRVGSLRYHNCEP
jgi:hypothetical protein